MSAALGDLVLFGAVPALVLVWLVMLAARVWLEARRPRVSRWARER